MKMSLRRTSTVNRLFFVIVLVGFLAACGGGGGSSNPPPGSAPPPNPAPPTFNYDGIGLATNLDLTSPTEFTAVSGESQESTIVVLKADSSIPFTASLSAGPNWVSVDAVLSDEFAVRIAPPNGTSGEFLATVLLENTERNLSQAYELLIDVRELGPPTSQVFGASGGRLINADGDIVIVMEAGELSQEITLELRTARASDGEVEIRLTSDTDLSSIAARIAVEEILPSVSGKVLVGPNQAITSTTNQRCEFEVQDDVDDEQFAPYPLESYCAVFSVNRGERVVPRSFSLSSVLCDLTSVCFQYKPAAGLFSPRPSQCFSVAADEEIPEGCSSDDQGAQFQPVIFVHGYKVWRGIGGGNATWNDFLAQSASIEFNETLRVAPFEFRWRTNASFRVVADDLRRAILEVQRLTGRRVHLVGHSMGGLLIRAALTNQTYRQSVLGITPRDDIQDSVLSVLTVSSPHSGIYDATEAGPVTNVIYPGGQDAPSFEFCNQISCWQLGEPLDFLQTVQFRLDDFDYLQRGEFLDLILATPDAPITGEVPMVAAIALSGDENGLYRAGDRLISFDGQRISPDLSADGSLQNCRSSGFGVVSEFVLGEVPNDGISPVDRLPGQPVQGLAYAHTRPDVSTLAGGADQDLNERSAVFYNLNDQRDRQHGTVTLHLRMLLDAQLFTEAGVESEFCVEPSTPGPPTAPELALAFPTFDSILLTWNRSIGGDPPYDYNVFDMTNPLSPTLVGVTTDSSFQIDGLPPGTEFCYEVIAVDNQGAQSEASNRLCATTEGGSSPPPSGSGGWQALTTGDPGVPGDGTLVNSIQSGCGSSSCWDLEPAFPLPAGASALTVSVYREPELTGYSMNVRFVDASVLCSYSVSTDLEEVYASAPVANGIFGQSLIIPRQTLENWAQEVASSNPTNCGSGSADNAFISRIFAGNGQMDGVYVGTAADDLPDGPNRQSLDTNWRALEDGDPGYPGDGITIQQQSRHVVAEQVSLGTSDGLTFGFYSDSQVLSRLEFRFVGADDACSFEFPLGNGLLYGSPTINGVAGGFYGVDAVTASGLTAQVAGSNPTLCGNISTSDFYLYSFDLAGSSGEIDGIYVTRGLAETPTR